MSMGINILGGCMACLLTLPGSVTIVVRGRFWRSESGLKIKGVDMVSANILLDSPTQMYDWACISSPLHLLSPSVYVEPKSNPRTQ